MRKYRHILIGGALALACLSTSTSAMVAGARSCERLASKSLRFAPAYYSSLVRNDHSIQILPYSDKRYSHSGIHQTDTSCNPLFSLISPLVTTLRNVRHSLTSPFIDALNRANKREDFASAVAWSNGREYSEEVKNVASFISSNGSPIIPFSLNPFNPIPSLEAFDKALDAYDEHNYIFKPLYEATKGALPFKGFNDHSIYMIEHDRHTDEVFRNHPISGGSTLPSSHYDRQIKQCKEEMADDLALITENVNVYLKTIRNLEHTKPIEYQQQLRLLRFNAKKAWRTVDGRYNARIGSIPYAAYLLSMDNELQFLTPRDMIYALGSMISGADSYYNGTAALPTDFVKLIFSNAVRESIRIQESDLNRLLSNARSAIEPYIMKHVNKAREKHDPYNIGLSANNVEDIRKLRTAEMAKFSSDLDLIKSLFTHPYSLIQKNQSAELRLDARKRLVIDAIPHKDTEQLNGQYSKSLPAGYTKLT
jgi:hypothetical protein